MGEAGAGAGAATLLVPPAATFLDEEGVLAPAAPSRVPPPDFGVGCRALVFCRLLGRGEFFLVLKLELLLEAKLPPEVCATWEGLPAGRPLPGDSLENRECRCEASGLLEITRC